MWINSFFWYTVDPADHTSPLGKTCTPILKKLGQQNGLTPDGTPIVKTGDELDNILEANGCAAEGQLAFDGSDRGAIWLVYPRFQIRAQGPFQLMIFFARTRHTTAMAPFRTSVCWRTFSVCKSLECSSRNWSRVNKAK